MLRMGKPPVYPTACLPTCLHARLHACLPAHISVKWKIKCFDATCVLFSCSLVASISDRSLFIIEHIYGRWCQEYHGLSASYRERTPRYLVLALESTGHLFLCMCKE